LVRTAKIDAFVQASHFAETSALIGRGGKSRNFDTHLREFPDCNPLNGILIAADNDANWDVNEIESRKRL